MNVHSQARLRTRLHLIIGLLASPGAIGCGSEEPFPLEDVRGTVTYANGTPIKADQIRITFEPVDIPKSDSIAPRAAFGYADVNDGTFSNLTTWKNGDGAIVGRHKVVLIALSSDEQGRTERTNAVPKIYQRAKTTPLEVDVVRGGDNKFDITIDKDARR